MSFIFFREMALFKLSIGICVQVKTKQGQTMSFKYSKRIGQWTCQPTISPSDPTAINLMDLAILTSYLTSFPLVFLSVYLCLSPSPSPSTCPLPNYILTFYHENTTFSYVLLFWTMVFH